MRGRSGRKDVVEYASDKALSSGEAKYYALVKSAAEGLGMQALARDLGWEMRLKIWVDATAAKSIASRVGLGKIMHLETKYLWAQEAVKKKRISLHKVKGTVNPSGALTKPMSRDAMQHLFGRVGLQIFIVAAGFDLFVFRLAPFSVMRQSVFVIGFCTIVDQSGPYPTV